ncbi:MAG TPA: hypothetical protein VLC95_03595, partial [Anaerolineae bacterium]|nr:hypothetical protein [Anaerolineae bacterium]
KALYVDVPGGAPGTQHREYSLGTVTITDGTFNLYVRDGDQLGGTYPFFGWAWIRLVDHYVQMTSSSATMRFDGNANAVFGELGDDVASLVGGTVIIAAVDETAATDVTITATDALGRWGAASYDIIYPTAVTLTSFQASPGAGHVALTWETATEIDSLGFNLYRSDHASGPYIQLNDTLIPSQAPGLPTGATYAWSDAAVAAGVTYYYQLEAVDMRGRLVQLGPVSATPHAFRFYLPLLTR